MLSLHLMEPFPQTHGWDGVVVHCHVDQVVWDGGKQDYCLVACAGLVCSRHLEILSSEHFSFSIDMYTYMRYCVAVLERSLSSIHRVRLVLRACLQATGAEVGDKAVGGHLEGK